MIEQIKVWLESMPQEWLNETDSLGYEERQHGTSIKPRDRDLNLGFSVVIENQGGLMKLETETNNSMSNPGEINLMLDTVTEEPMNNPGESNLTPQAGVDIF